MLLVLGVEGCLESDGSRELSEGDGCMGNVDLAVGLSAMSQMA